MPKLMVPIPNGDIEVNGNWALIKLALLPTNDLLMIPIPIGDIEVNGYWALIKLTPLPTIHRFVYN